MIFLSKHDFWNLFGCANITKPFVWWVLWRYYAGGEVGKGLVNQELITMHQSERFLLLISNPKNEIAA